MAAAVLGPDEAARGLSNFRCNWILIRLVAAGGQPSVEGQVEGVVGGFPPHGPSYAALAGRVEAHQREVVALEGGRLGREVAAGVDRATQPGVDGLDGVG